jgi:hypothetical protein
MLSAVAVPLEGFGVLVVFGDVVIDGLDKMLDGTKTASTNGLSGDLCKLGQI